MKVLENTPFVVGITGHMDLRDEEVPLLKARVETVLRFLVSRPKPDQPTPLVEQLIALLSEPGDRDLGAAELEAFRRSLNGWPAFEKTPLVVLTSLAPGADSLVAEVALELRDAGLAIEVVAPLPMHHDLYATATTFQDRDGTIQAAKQERYRDLLAKIGIENTFAVRTESDFELSEDEFRAACVKDIASAESRLRHARYRAAGEYIAEYAHFLIAIWDHHDNYETSEGAAAIVHARRNHLQFDLLPGNVGLNLPHGGPVLQLCTTRARNAQTPPSEPAARFLTCSQAEIHGGHAASAEELRRRQAAILFNELSLCSRIARNVEEFNHLPPPSDQQVEAELNDLMQLKSGQSLAPLLVSQGNPDLLQNYREFAKLRRRPSDANRPLTSQRNRTLVQLFWLTLLAASLGHLFVEWHPQQVAKAGSSHEETDHAHTAPSDQPGNEPHTSPKTNLEAGLHGATETHAGPADVIPAGKTDVQGVHNPSPPAIGKQAQGETHGESVPAENKDGKAADGKGKNGLDHAQEHHFDWRRPLWGFLACGIALGAIWLYTSRRSERSIERAHDFRAVAEGLRVQGYWNLAGLGASVPANYMQRQRSELDWIRGVIRAASMPYAYWREGVERLDLPAQALAFRLVLENWVQTQEVYFENATRKRLFELHSWHKLGMTFALAGVFGTMVSVSSSLIDSHEPLSWLIGRWRLGLGLTALFAMLTFVDSLLRRLERLRDPFASHHSPPKISTSGFLGTLKALAFRWADRWIVTSHSQPTEYVSPEKDKWRMLRNGVTYFFPAAAFAFFAATVASVIAMVWTTAPGVTVWTSIFLGIYLIGGAMCIAWTEKQLDSEFAYQYGTMAPLFRSARIRLAPLVERLEQLAVEGKTAEFIRCRAEARGVIHELGKEALDENAEWLILHRARPLEPVMAG